MTKITKFTSTLAIAFAFAGGTAMAQSPADEVYNPNGGVLDVVETATPAPSATPAPTQAAAPESSTESEAPDTATTPSTPAATATPAAPTTQTQEAQTGDLPFTGFEAGFVALAGLALLGGGLAMRRAAREQ